MNTRIAVLTCCTIVLAGSGCATRVSHADLVAQAQASWAEHEKAIAAREAEVERRRNEETQKRDRARQKVLSDPLTSPKVAAGIREGKLVVGMSLAEAQAAIGDVTWESQSDGVGGESTFYHRYDHVMKTTLLFDDGRLVRWWSEPRHL